MQLNLGDPTVKAASLQEISDATPPGRDRYIDLLRVVAIGSVVAGHWLMAVVQPTDDGGATTTNALEQLKGAQVLTWLLQVMPLFFFVGGFVHATGVRSLRIRGGGYGDFVRARANRLLRPTLLFLLIWLAIAVVFQLSGRQGQLEALVTDTAVQPLWFIGVYLALIALAPPMFVLHEHWGSAVSLALIIAAVVVDVSRFQFDLAALAPLNVIFIWLAVHQLGFSYADGALGRRVGAIFAVGGLAALTVLTVVSGWYPISMVGLPGDRFSNMNPPTLAILVQALWLIGLALLVKAPVSRWLSRPKVWRYVVGANAVVMTTFLWHLSALFIAYLVLIGFNISLPAVGSAIWWASRLPWLMLLAALCVALVGVFRAAERPSPGAAHGGGALLPAIGITVAAIGVLGVAFNGLNNVLNAEAELRILVPVSAASGLVFVAVGWLLLRYSGRRAAASQLSVNC
ncbi:MAG: acyltransferase [Acidimicrobiales bacterium]|nr:MAG: acyltransferase [Acidimicrobiales bacterium]